MSKGLEDLTKIIAYYLRLTTILFLSTDMEPSEYEEEKTRFLKEFNQIEKELKTLEILQQYFDISLWEEFDTDRNYAYISINGENRRNCASKNIGRDERAILREVLK